MSDTGAERHSSERGVLDTAAMARWLAPTSQSRIERIPCESIDDRDLGGIPTIDDDAATALRRSVGHRGVAEPLLLRPHGDGRFQVVIGSRRLQAARDLGLATVPAIVRELDDAEAALLAAWAVLPRLGAAELAGVAERLSDAGIPSGEIALLLATRGVHTAVRSGETLRLLARAPLRFTGGESALDRLLDALGERREAALAAVTALGSDGASG